MNDEEAKKAQELFERTSEKCKVAEQFAKGVVTLAEATSKITALGFGWLYTANALNFRTTEEFVYALTSEANAHMFALGAKDKFIESACMVLSDCIEIIKNGPEKGATLKEDLEDTIGAGFFGMVTEGKTISEALRECY